jgi:hypothetical protein
MIWFESLYRVTVNNLTMKAVRLIFIKSGRLSFFIKPDPCLFFVMRLEEEDWLFLLY